MPGERSRQRRGQRREQRGGNLAAQTVGVTPDARSISRRDSAVEFLAVKETADQPTEPAVAARSKAQFLSKGGDLVGLILVGEIGAGEIDILNRLIGLIPKGRNGGGGADGSFPIQLCRNALAVESVARIRVEYDIVVELIRGIPYRLAQAVGRGSADELRRRPVVERDDPAASLGDYVVVGDDA